MIIIWNSIKEFLFHKAIDVNIHKSIPNTIPPWTTKFRNSIQLSKYCISSHIVNVNMKLKTKIF